MFVGREDEVALIAQRIGMRQPLAVLGEAGVGKTALVRVAADRVGARLVEAGGLATLSWLPYLPLRRAFGHEFEGDAAFVASIVAAELGDSVLFLDDFHWADEQTASLLPLLEGIPAVAAVRRGDPSTSATIERLAEAGFELLPLEPLAPEAALELAHLLVPDSAQAARQRLVSMSGGNPFLLEQLAVTGEPNGSLKLAVAARLRGLSPEGREAIGALALLGRPAEPDLLGPGGDELVDAGLAVANGAVAIRHALLAETTVEALSDDERREIHGRLAAALGDGGEAARHYAAAGMRAEAFRNAMQAAESAGTAGERAAHLELAARCVDGAEAESVRVRAAAALADAGRFDSAEAILEDLIAGDPSLRAECALIRSRARKESGDQEAALAALADADGLVVEPSVEVRLAAQRVELELETGFQAVTSETVDRALAAFALARRHGCYQAEALYSLGRAEFLGGCVGWERRLRASMAAARASGDIALECRVAEAFGTYLFTHGRITSSRRMLAATAARARAADLLSWDRRLRTRVAWLDLHAGRFRVSAEAAEELLLEGLEPWQRFLVAYIAAQAAVDLGRHERAQELIHVLAARVAGEYQERIRLWVLADAHIWSGRPRDALAVADESLERFPESTSTFVRLTRSWACLELGLDPGPPVWEAERELLEGAWPEFQAVSHAARGDWDEAAGQFAEAAAKWAGRHVRGELRCLWAEGEALRRAGLEDRAVKRLLEAERRAAKHEHEPLLGRIRRSLRLAGVNRKAARSVDATGLTGREAEVLELVADGLTNDEIARRLGLGRPTVVRLIRSAQLKLGASNRTQAAALAARR